MVGLLQMRYIMATDFGLTENFVSQIDLNAMNPATLMASFLRVLSVCGLTKDMIDILFDQDIEDIIEETGLSFPDGESEEEESEEPEDHQGERITADEIESLLDKEKKKKIMVNDSERVVNFLKRLEENPALAREAYRAFLDSLDA